MPRAIAVVGSGECTEAENRFAVELGRRAAESGWTVVTGGLGGVMLAASRGAKLAGGLTVGILPGRNGDEGNEFLDVVIPTGMGELRNGIVVAAADVIVAVGGEYGTLSEIALALKTGKTVIGWNTWNLAQQRSLTPAIIAVASIDEACWEIEKALEPGRHF